MNTFTVPSGIEFVGAATGTLVGRATTDTLTHKTFDTAGAGNSFSINGVAISAVTGTGAAALAVSPAFTGTVTATALSMGGAINLNSHFLSNVLDPVSA